jgi:glyoxylase-like metal-dependent hydrolase (beta-lactamase superfamily II)
MVSHVTTASAELLEALPDWVTLVRAPNPSPMTLDGTNTWVLHAPGREAALVIDPGPQDGRHLAALAARAPLAAVLVTHGHPDHVAGLERFVELTRPAAIEATGIRLDVLATPGHTADSVCYVASHGGDRVVLTGDTIIGRGTAVVAYPDGDLAEYLQSLRTLTSFAAVPALVGHGPALADTAAAARFYLAHRLARLEQVRVAVAAGASSPQRVVEVVYADVDPSLWPAAELSVRAQLAYLGQDPP